MLVELSVSGLGVIDGAHLELGSGLTALTGETGAGKTLLVEALAIVLGGRPAKGLIADGETARVEATFLDVDGREVILAREIPAEGRARSFVDGRSATLAVLQEAARGLLDIYGQHEHQSLLRPGAVRRALDAFAGVDLGRLEAARSAVREIKAEQEELGGDLAELQRRAELCEHEVTRIDSAGVKGPDELEHLLTEAALLAGAAAISEEIARGSGMLAGEHDESPRDVLARIRAQLEQHEALSDASAALLSAESAFDEALLALRSAAERVEDDPARREEVDQRLAALHELVRLHGPTLADVIEARSALDAEARSLRTSIDRVASLSDRALKAAEELEAASGAVAEMRRHAAPALLEALRGRLADLALPRAVVDLEIGGEAGDRIELLFSANQGHRPQPVSQAASGGELARLMLALRLILPGGPSCMVFDEVDAGIGGSTALVLADALAEVATTTQVLVITHLAQVAATADRQVGVIKRPGDRDIAEAVVLEGEARVAEIARMLSGHPDSASARSHAVELLGRSSPGGLLRGLA